MRGKAGLLLILVPLICCGPEREKQREYQQVAVRFIDETEERFFDDFEPIVEHERFDWTFADANERQQWEAFPITSEITFNKASLRLCSGSRRAYLFRDVDFPADTIHAFEVRLTGSGLSRARLCWKGASAADADQGCSVARRNEHGTFTFEVLKHPDWTGRIKRISLTPLVEKEGCSEVFHITGKSYSLKPEKVKAAFERSWKVTLNDGPHGVTRGCLLSPPGVPIIRRVPVGPEAVLRFSFGLEPGVRGPVTFLVHVQSGSGTPPETVFEETIASKNVLLGSGWHEGRVDLKRFAGREVVLTLETDSVEPNEVVRGFPVWGHPEVVESRFGRPPKNLILISVDTLRADHMSLYGYDRETTPNIDRWASDRGIVFETVVAPSPWTIPSHASLFTGRDALSHGINHVQRIPEEQTLLAGILRKAGYQTAAITGGGFLAPRFGFSAGFDRYLHWNIPAAGEDELNSGIELLTQWLDSSPERPFFFFFHTYEVHSPYRPREPFYSRFTGRPPADSRLIGERNQKASSADGFRTRREWIWLSDPTKLREGMPLLDSEMSLGSDFYDSQVAFLDSQLGHLLNSLEISGLAENTVVIVTSDHGESLGEDGLMGHTDLLDSNLLVPLIIGLPGSEYGGQVIESPVRSIDVLPTVLDLLEIPPTPDIDGKSLTALMAGQQTDSPIEAWSYAGKYNGGVSLRIGNQSKYVFNDTAWTSVWGQEDLQLFENTPKPDPEIDQERALTASLRSRVRNRLETTARGLQIHFSNKDLIEFSGRMSGDAIDVARLKSSEPTVNLSYRGSRTMDFVIPAEQAYDVILETPTLSGPLEVAVSIGERTETSTFKTEIDPARESWTLCRRGESWVEGATPDGSECTGITLRWKNRSTGDLDHAQEVQPELLEQLHALGYAEE